MTEPQLSAEGAPTPASLAKDPAASPPPSPASWSDGPYPSGPVPAAARTGLPVGPDGLVRPDVLPLATPWRRLGGYAMEVLLAVVTLGIGYLIWDLVVWQRGKTPGKQVLGMTVVNAETGMPADWTKMFVRQFLVMGLLIFGIGSVTFYILPVVASAMIFSVGNRTLWDRIAKTYVVRDAA